MRDDHGVVAAAGNAGHGAPAVAAREMVPAGNEEFGLRIQLEKFRAPLLDQMVGHHEHGLFGKPQAAHLHGGGRHRPGLAPADHMAQKRAAALQHAPDRVFLVRGQVTVAQMLADHAGQGQMRAVERAQTQIVEAVVIVARQPRGAVGIFPDPFAEPVLDLLLLLAGGDCLLLIDDARSVFAFVISGGRASVQSGLDELGGPEPRGAVRRRVADIPARRGLHFQRPGRNRLGMPDAHGIRRGLQQLCDEIADIGCRNPG
jgi:hypothetical protein